MVFSAPELSFPPTLYGGAARSQDPRSALDHRTFWYFLEQFTGVLQI
jgi:hypothetical protein